jgi:hypothetical protein
MASKSNYSLVRGRRMRITRLNGCGVPIDGPASQVVTDGFISVAFTAQTTEAEDVEVTNANGDVCVSDKGRSKFNGYGLEITVCNVQPCLLEMMTGMPVVVDADGEVSGFRMNTKVDTSVIGYALELWMGVPGVSCGTDAQAGSFGYLLIPFVGPGVLGDFTVENAAINFTITGSSTKDGNGWGVGPTSYKPVPGANGTGAAQLADALDLNDHLYMTWTSVAPPDVTNGCVALNPPDLTGVTAGTPGSFAPADALIPRTLADLKADPVVGDAGTAKPSTAWTVGQYVVLGDGSFANWSGDPTASWKAGKATA